MNHVFLSGTVETSPKVVSQDNNVLHAIMDLTVIHKNAAGVEKKEQYPISAWRGIAKRMMELITPGSRVSIKGYLSQKQTAEGIFLEVTVEEFQVSDHSLLIRPLRRNAVPIRSAKPVCKTKEKSDSEDEHPIETVPDLIAMREESAMDQ